jgi:hypothetical protein
MDTMTFSSSLVQSFLQHPLGLCGRHEPAQIVGKIKDIERRLSILTLGVVLDPNHLSQDRWSALADVHDHWLFIPSQAAHKTSPQILEGMQQLRLGAPQHLARVWWQICRGVQGRTKGSWRELLKLNEDNAQTLLGYLGNSKTTFPVLSGPVISVRWLDLIQRIGGVELQGWETLRVPLPGDQKKPAHLFGVDADDVHPAFASALKVWEGACQKLPGAACGLADCPRR